MKKIQKIQKEVLFPPELQRELQREIEEFDEHQRLLKLDAIKQAEQDQLELL